MNYVKGLFRWLRKSSNDHATLKSCIEHYGAISKITRLMLIYAVIMLSFIALVMITTRCTPSKKVSSVEYLKAVKTGDWPTFTADTSIMIDNYLKQNDWQRLFFSDTLVYPINGILANDTVACVYLYCDTTIKSNAPQWKKGYSVYEVSCCTNGNTSVFAVYQPVNYRIFKEYLDEKRKPVSKNIIIWISK